MIVLMKKTSGHDCTLLPNNLLPKAVLELKFLPCEYTHTSHKEFQNGLFKDHNSGQTLMPCLCL